MKNVHIMKKEMRAYFTVEAAVFVSMMIFSMAKGMMMAMDYYMEVKEASFVSEELISPDQIDIILKAKAIRKGVDLISGNTISTQS